MWSECCSIKILWSIFSLKTRFASRVPPNAVSPLLPRPYQLSCVASCGDNSWDMIFATVDLRSAPPTAPSLVILINRQKENVNALWHLKRQHKPFQNQDKFSQIVKCCAKEFLPWYIVSQYLSYRMGQTGGWAEMQMMPLNNSKTVRDRRKVSMESYRRAIKWYHFRPCCVYLTPKIRVQNFPISL